MIKTGQLTLGMEFYPGLDLRIYDPIELTFADPPPKANHFVAWGVRKSLFYQMFIDRIVQQLRRLLEAALKQEHDACLDEYHLRLEQMVQQIIKEIKSDRTMSRDHKQALFSPTDWVLLLVNSYYELVLAGRVRECWQFMLDLMLDYPRIDELNPELCRELNIKLIDFFFKHTDVED